MQRFLDLFISIN